MQVLSVEKIFGEMFSTPLAREGTSLQADKFSPEAPSGLPDTGSSGLAFFFFLLHFD